MANYKYNLEHIHDHYPEFEHDFDQLVSNNPVVLSIWSHKHFS
jgi:hypothetical protein